MIVEKLHHAAQQFPENTAIIFEDYQINYVQLTDIINKLANGLKDSGINGGDRVALMMPNLPHFVFSYYAIQQAGAVVVPINYMLESDDLNLMLNNAKPAAIIYWEGFRSALNDFFEGYTDPISKIVLGKKKAIDTFALTELIAQSSEDNQFDAPEADHVAIIQYTSGITDLPVGVELSHENLSASIETYINFLRLTNDEVFGVIFPLFFITTQNTILNSALTLGATIVLHSKLEIESVIKSIDQHNISVLTASPNVYHQLTDLKGENFSGSSVKHCLSSHSMLSEEIAKNFKDKFGISLLNGYATTETSGIVAATHPSENINDSVGLALPGIEVQIHDTHGEQVDSNEIGEIAIRGKSVLKKYWDNDELTSARLKNGWFYSGDLGKKNTDGYITFIDKKADVILKSGFQIDSTEIEQTLLTHPKIKEAAVISIPHQDHKEDVQACVVLNENESVTDEEIIQFCRDHIPVYKCPQVIKFYSELPRTRMGKIFKRKLRKM
ncbi:MAG: AMP-binding protein [Bacteroidales bacterium]|nr:AMP-binding protein [Bacteroidales bacterium]